MGEIYANGLIRTTIAVYEDGIVYDSSSMWRKVIGYYGNGYIEDAYHKTVAKYSAGTAYDLDGFPGIPSSGTALCYCSGSTIYEGGSSWNNRLGSYEGDPDGACAAAVLFFSLYDKKEKSTREETQKTGGGVGDIGPDRVSIWGILISVLICILMVYIFWFTDNGREMLFIETTGQLVFASCFLSTIIGSSLILYRNQKTKVRDIAGYSAMWYLLAVVLACIIMLRDEAVYGKLTFGMGLATVLFAPFIVFGAATPIFVVQVITLSLIQRLRFNKSKNKEEVPAQNVEMHIDLEQVSSGQDDGKTNLMSFSKQNNNERSNSDNSNCDVKEMKVKKKGRTKVFVLSAGMLVLVGIAFFTIHFWTEATCTEPSVCKLCGKERGDALGHKWVSADCTHTKNCSLCGSSEGAPLGHVWQEATCVMPRTCVFCLATEGDLTNHIWQNATCINPKTCLTCGTAEGTALGHDWMPATFLAPQTCARCDATEGTNIPYEHIDVEREVESIRAIYYDIKSGIKDGFIHKYKLKDGVEGYYDASGKLKSIVVYHGTEGIGGDSGKYSRSYYYDDGELVFAFFEGSDSHRLYFYDGLLMRWLYRSKTSEEYHDFDFTSRYLELEQMAREESQLLFQ